MTNASDRPVMVRYKDPKKIEILDVFRSTSQLKAIDKVYPNNTVCSPHTIMPVPLPFSAA